MSRTIMRECPRHGVTEHVLLQNGSYKCKECRKEAVLDIRRRNKIRLVEYKGGKCEICGYDKCIDALEFHHLDPNEKEFGIAGDTRSLEKLKKEADKCVLICANCHRELHAKEREDVRAKKEQEEIERSIVYFENKNVKEKKQSKFIIKNKLNVEDIKEDINNKLSKKEISKKYKVGLTTLKRFLKKNGIEYVESKGGKLENLNKDEFIDSFKELKTFGKVGKKYGVSDKSIQKWCERNNLPWRKKELVEYIDKI
jgi:hypothetical protein